MSFRKILWLIVFVLCFCSAGHADTIYLKNGKVVEGQIVNETAYYITVIENNAMVDYFDDEVERIEKSGGNAVSKPDQGDQQIKKVESAAIATDDISASKHDLILTLMEANGTRKDIEARINNLLVAVDANQRVALSKVFKLEDVLESLVPVYSKFYTQDELSQIVDFYQSPVGKKVYAVTPDLISDALETIVKYFREKFDSVNK